MSSKEIGTKAATQASPQDEVRFTEKMNDFMHANKKIFMGLGIGVLVLVAALGVFSVVSRSILVKSTTALEKLESAYEGWASIEDTEKAAKSAELVAEADVLIAKYGKSYAAIRASMIKAELLFSANDIAGAEKAYAASAESYPKSHLAPVALANAAAMAEDRGDTDTALAYLMKAEEKYPGAPGAGRIVLSIARIYETTKLYDKAMETYTRLVATGVESDWTKIAHDRIILLKSQGLAQ